ncbi:MAG TPA: hypothetical protein VN030_10475 [Cellvibrio sp.]|nr:hypothetical protein [Cellvibrio sp.]
MFYVPYKFRQQTEYCTPKGPDISWAPWVRFSINDTNISLKVPRHSTKSSMMPRNPRRNYTLDAYHFSNHRSSKDGWLGCPLSTRGWDFNGSWFIGTRASLHMYANIITPSEANESLSFFHPRAFESGIADFMTYLYGEETSEKDGSQDWFAPMDWQPLTGHPCIAVQFDAIENVKVAGNRTDRYLFFPLSDHHLLQIVFGIARNKVWIGSNPSPEPDTSKWIDNTPMEKLASDIINTLQITMSPGAKQQQEKALAGTMDASLVKDFPPIKWNKAANKIG